MTPEEQARKLIDEKLSAAGWIIQDRTNFNRNASTGIACREFLMADNKEADYILFIDGKAAGVIEAKKAGTSLSGIENQSQWYGRTLPRNTAQWQSPLPFIYESNGSEIFFTDMRDSKPARRLFNFQKPETLKSTLEQGSSLRQRLQNFPVLWTNSLRDCQFEAISKLEKSLSEGRPRALIQMATGSGKTYTACNFIYRLIKHAKAKRVLFLVDRNNLGRQTLKEFQSFRNTDNGRPFTELHVVQHLQSNVIDSNAEVVITTIQRLYSMLRGEKEFDANNEEISAYESTVIGPDKQVFYNKDIPPEFFDIIVTDECHRSIYGLWRQVLEYFDAFLIGLTATPSKQTLGYFNQNLVAEYPYERSVADNVNVGYDIYRIRTEISEHGGTVPAGYEIPKIERLTRRRIYERLNEELTYSPNDLDRTVIAENQIRTVLQTYKDKVFTDLFPERAENQSWLPKTLIFAKDDTHAENIVRIARDVFACGNDFCKKITYNVSGVNPEDLINDFRNSTQFRIAVTVDMIATGTDIKPLEVLIFMRDVHSEIYYEQMKGRGCRTLPIADLRRVTPNAVCKSKFILIDAAGVTESKKTVSQPLERKKTVPLKKLLEYAANGTHDDDDFSSLAARISRLENFMPAEDQRSIEEKCNTTLSKLANGLLDAIDPDKLENKTEQEVENIKEQAIKPFSNPVLGDMLLNNAKKAFMYVDDITPDYATQFAPSTDREQAIIDNLQQFIEKNKDSIAALSIIYNRSYGRAALNYEGIKELADALKNNNPSLDIPVLWGAFARKNPGKVANSARPERMLTNVIQIMRFALGQDDELRPFDAVANQRYNLWIGRMKQRGIQFTEEQKQWLDRIKEFIVYNSSITEGDIQDTLSDKGGLIRARQLFDMPALPLSAVLSELNTALVYAN